MGAKAKASRRTKRRYQATPAETAPIAATEQQTKKQTKPTKQQSVERVLRDALFGDPLIAGAMAEYIRLADYDASRPEQARQPIPTRINVAQVSAGGLGGHEWAPEFRRYMANVLPRLVAEERLMWLRWWDVAYVRQRLTKRLGTQTVEVALLCLRDGAETDDVAHEYQRSPDWVRRQIWLTARLAETYFTHRRSRPE